MADSAISLRQGFYKLPEGWKWCRLGEVAKINKEQRNPAVEWPNEKFIYIDISGVENGRIREVKQILGKDAPSRARRVVHTNDIIMSTVRPYLKSFALIPEEYDNQICSTGFAVLTCVNEMIIPQYLLYVLFSDIVIDQCNRMMTGAHYPALRESQIPQILIPLPPLEEQHRIVARVEQLLSKVEEAKRLRKQAREEAEKIMRAALYKVFSRAEKEGWEWVKLGDVLIKKPQYGLTAKSSKDRKRIRYIRISDIADDGTLKNDDPRFLDLNEEEFQKYKLEENDILIARSGTVGRIYIHKPINQKAVFASYLIRFRLDKRLVIPKFFFYYGLSSFYKNFIEDTLRIVAQPNINAKEYCKLEFPLPPICEQEKIVAYLDRIKDEIESLKRLQQKTEEELEKLTPAILDRAFRGELV